MSSPLDVLRAGIVGGNWDTVCEGFRMLTGERLTAPAVTAGALLPTGSNELYLAVGRAAYERLAAYRADDVKKSASAKKPPKKTAPPPSPPPPPPAPPEKPTDELSQFEVQHGRPTRADGKRECVAEPFRPPTGNEFVDDKALAPEEIAESVRLSQSRPPKSYREPNRAVEVQCAKCKNKEMVEPIFVPRYTAGEDGSQSGSYVCNSCIKKRGRD